jgi:hypothetical protein
MKIDLNDNVYDWCYRATTISHFPSFYDFVSNKNANPLNDHGHFDVNKYFSHFRREKQIENFKIY